MGHDDEREPGESPPLMHHDQQSPPPLRPDPADEGRHEPGAELLWNESYYFDGVTEDGDLGVYVRLGRLPNQGCALYAACVTGPGRASIMLVDTAAPLPDDRDDTQTIRTDSFHAEQHCEVPLQRFRVRVEGTAQAHQDPSAPLREEEGEPVEIAVDLVWQTDGIGYQWRATTRYEMPCRVSGTVRVGDEQRDFAGPGQRDHSWSARDWWANDWVWSALHLSDGTHTHAVGLPDLPGVGAGYVQRGEEITELDSVHTSTDIADNGLVTAARIESGPDPLTLDIEPVAFGAILLRSTDGRTAHFPRALCRARTTDGRVGTGWVEWNRNQQ